MSRCKTARRRGSTFDSAPTPCRSPSCEPACERDPQPPGQAPSPSAAQRSNVAGRGPRPSCWRVAPDWWSSAAARQGPSASAFAAARRTRCSCCWTAQRWPIRSPAPPTYRRSPRARSSRSPCSRGASRRASARARRRAWCSSSRAPRRRTPGLCAWPAARSAAGAAQPRAAAVPWDSSGRPAAACGPAMASSCSSGQRRSAVAATCG